jgi:DNA-directed RNA polymerase specialized sigma24 family protein
VFRVHHDDGLSFQAAGDTLGVSHQTAFTAYHAAVKSLQRCLIARGYGPEHL